MSANSIRWAGIGSRETPSEVLSLMTQFAAFMASKGHELSTGGAAGADSAFMVGAIEGKAQIHLPWASYKSPGLAQRGKQWRIYTTVTAGSMELAERYHPAWERCSPGARTLHARNGNIILGLDLNTPVAFVVCWTRGGTGAGGTGQALRLARDRGIPILDLGVFTEVEDMKAALNALYLEHKG